jgi:hypothetical protein
MSRSSPSLPQKDRTSKPAQALDASVVVGNSITPSDAGQHSTYMLPRIRLLQLGDIHLPNAANLKPHIDAKDQKFSPALKNIISRNPLKTVFRRAYEQSWLRIFAQGAKWNFCLTARTVVHANQEQR